MAGVLLGFVMRLAAKQRLRVCVSKTTLAVSTICLIVISGLHQRRKQHEERNELSLFHLCMCVEKRAWTCMLFCILALSFTISLYQFRGVSNHPVCCVLNSNQVRVCLKTSRLLNHSSFCYLSK